MLGAIAMVLTLLAAVEGAGLWRLSQVSASNERFLASTYANTLVLAKMRTAIGDMRRYQKDLLINCGSAEAARKTQMLIGASVEEVETGARLVRDAGSTMGEIVASVQRATDIVGEISAAAAEQSSGIATVNGAVSQLDPMTQQNAALVEESAAAAESLNGQAQRLAAVVGRFQLGNNAPLAAHTATAPAGT